MGRIQLPRRSRLLLAVAVLACGLALTHPPSAHAGWPLASVARVELAFGATYRGAESTSSSTHHGVDLVAASGSRVMAPLAGEVTFAGRVPAVGGGSVLAVTISTSSGAVTLLPIASLAVARGRQLAEGDEVGSLAASGDGSSAGTHLHVGLKRGDLYIDPLDVMSPPAAASGGLATATNPQLSARAASSRVAGTAAASGASAVGHASGAGVQVNAGMAVQASGAHAGVRAPVAGAQLAPGVSVAGGSAAWGSSAAAGVGGSAQAGAAKSSGLGASVTPAETPAPSLTPLLARVGRLAERTERGAAWGLAGILAAIGALWPVWRRDTQQGSSKVQVRPIRDDIAAVPGR